MLSSNLSKAFITREVIEDLGVTIFGHWDDYGPLQLFGNLCWLSDN